MCARSAANSEPAAGEGNAANSWERAAGGAAIELSGPGQQVRLGSRPDGTTGLSALLL